MLEIASMRDLPDQITSVHVIEEAKRYPRAFVLLEDQDGWAVYSTKTKTRKTEYRRNWIAALLDLAMLLSMVTTNVTNRSECGRGSK